MASLQIAFGFLGSSSSDGADPRPRQKRHASGAADAQRSYRTSIMESEVARYLSSMAPEIRWGLLPERIRGMVGSEAEWSRLLRAHSISTQAVWTSSLGDEATYLNDMLTASRERGLLYPYHLAHELSAHGATRVSPFEYYVEMIMDRMRSERSYDTIPSFTAADCVRLVQCGRNEFIHALNALRSKGWLWKRRRALMAKQLPPTPPMDMPVLHYWEVHPTRAAAATLAGAAGARGRGGGKPATTAAAAMRRSLFGGTGGLGGAGGGAGGGAASRDTPGVDDAEEAEEEQGEEGASGGSSGPRRLTTSELEALGQVVSGSAVYAGQLPRESLGGLHAHGLVRFEVRVTAADRIAVPPLTGFVMNRVGNDYLEKVSRPATTVCRLPSAVCRLPSAHALGPPRVTFT